MAGYWLRVLHRAWTDTRRFFGWNKRTIVMPILFGVGSLFHLWWFGVSAMMDEIDLFISYSLAPVGAFTILLFLWNMIAAPPRMEYEASQKAETTERELRSSQSILQAQVKKKQGNETLAKNLQVIFDNGSELLNQTPGNFGEWTGQVIAWFQEAEAEMEGNLPASEIHMFRTISPVPKVKQDYVVTRSALDARLRKLRLIIGRLLD